MKTKFNTSLNKLILIPGFVMVFALFISCEGFWNNCKEGNGHISTETRTLSTFSRVEINGDFKVLVDTGSSSFAVIEADENLQDLIVTNVSGDKLIIETRNGDCLYPTHPVEIRIKTPSVSQIVLNGSGNVYCNGLISEELFLRLSGSGDMHFTEINAVSATLELEGSGNIDFGTNVEDLYAECEGSGEIRLNGEARNSELRVIGSGHLRASQLNTDICIAFINGSGTIDTDVNISLDVTIMGSGTVNYYGNPVISSYISGSGKIVRQ